ncbi:MAG TPA: tetratricopeptide repeat protein [Planctomycetota bacterium]|nr:tetratricopeptide repeat protein [Planctomycetota bacterium]
MTQLLLISSTIALILLIVHSWRTRGRAVTLAFFISAMVYGLIRENAIWLLMQHLTEGAGSVKPYLPQGGLLPEIGHAHLQVSIGWVFSMYLAWTISELILKRIPRFAGRVFMMAALSGLFMLTLCYCMETTAVSVGWWYWMLPTRSALFGNVNTLGMEGWFSVVPDFLLPFLVIFCADTRRKGLKWLWGLAFPLHIGGHMLYRWIPEALFVYHVLELLVVVPMMFSRLRMSRGEIRPSATRVGRLAAALPAVALIGFFGVVTFANVVSGEGPAILMTEVPLLMLCLLAWSRLPVWGTLVLSAAAAGGWVWIGARALWALVPTAAFAFLRLHERLRERLWMKLVPAAVVVLLSGVSVFQFEADFSRAVRYLSSLAEGDRMAFARNPQAASAAYARAERLRPESTILLGRAVVDVLRYVSGPARQTVPVPLLQQRIRWLTPEFEEVVRRDPEWLLPRIHLADLYLLQGRPADAARQYREIYRYRDRDPTVAAMLGYHLIRQGDVREAEQVCERVVKWRNPPVEALINLGVIRFAEQRDDEARRLWEEALRRDRGNVMARLNLERLDAGTHDRTIDERYLARHSFGAKAAPDIANNLAAYGLDVSPTEQMALLIEATQFDPSYLLAHQNLVLGYLNRGNPCCDLERGLWHARRAVAIARDRATHTDAELSQSLLLLGQALVANGQPARARPVLEEGRSIAPVEIRRDFDRLLGALGSLR